MASWEVSAFLDTSSHGEKFLQASHCNDNRNQNSEGLFEETACF